MNVQTKIHERVREHSPDKAEQNETKIWIQLRLRKQMLQKTQEHAHDARTDGIIETPAKERRETRSNQCPVEQGCLE